MIFDIIETVKEIFCQNEGCKKEFYKDFHPRACHTCARSKYDFITGARLNNDDCEMITGLIREAEMFGVPPSHSRMTDYQRQLDYLRYNGCPAWESREPQPSLKVSRFSKVDL